MFLYHVSKLFFLDSDVEHFSSMKNWYFLLVAAQSQRSSLELGRNGSGDHSLVAARSGRTCHLASSLPDKTLLCVCNTAPPYEELTLPCHLNMTRGSANVYSMTVSPLCSLRITSHCASNARAADIDVQRPPVLFSHTNHNHCIK